jgi:tetratricopeptide (TPR) repeat protein
LGFGKTELIMKLFRIVIIVLFCQSLGSQAQEEVQRLQALWSEQDLQDLKSALPEAKKKYPQNPTVLYMEALLLEDGEMAHQYYLRHLNAGTNEWTDDALFKVAQYHQIRGEYGLARKYFLLLCRRYPNSSLADDARYQRCSCFMAESRTDSARSCLDEFLKTDKRSPFVDWAINDLERLASANDSIPAPPPTVSKTDSKVYYVQVGAYRVPRNAKDYIKKLHDAGFDAQLVEKGEGDKKLYAVWLGAFKDRDAAVSFGKKNVAAFAPDFTIVQR